MLVSVVVCTHSTERYDALTEAVESVLEGSYEQVEVILVSDGSAAVAELMEQDYGNRNDVLIHVNDENLGLLESRNVGAELASGEVVAFLDDDAVAAPDWLERLVSAYKSREVLAVGGRMEPRWVVGKPPFLPEEFYWLIGVTHHGFGPANGGVDDEGEVRNTLGSNLSFSREVFLELGGFDTNIGGRKADEQLQGGETELCARLREKYGIGVWYVPEAVVEHKIFAYRTDFLWLLRRAFWQGYSKRGMETFVSESTGEESDFLQRLLIEFIPERVRSLLRQPSLSKAQQLIVLVVLLGAVGCGYGYGYVKWGHNHSNTGQEADRE